MVSEIRDYVVGIIFVTLLLVGGLSLIADMKSTAHDKAVQKGKPEPLSSSFDTTKFNATFNRYDKVVDSVDKLQSSVSTNSTGFFGYAGGAIEALFGGAYNTLGLVYSSFSFVTSTDPNNPGMLYGMTMMGVPTWFPILLIGIITVLIAFAILKAVFQVG